MAARLRQVLRLPALSPAGCREWSSSSPSRSSRQFLPERLGQFLRGQVPARPRTGSISSSKKRKKGSRKETPAIRNHWFDKMHQSVEGGARQRCSSISSNHPEKNGWDEHKPVIFANPPTLTQRTRVGRDGDVGRGTYIGDGSDVLTDPELAGHRWLPQPHPAYRRSGVPSTPTL